jgi:hypothetical protein
MNYPKIIISFGLIVIISLFVFFLNNVEWIGLSNIYQKEESIIKEYQKPEKLIKLGPDRYLYDFGKDSFGKIKIVSDQSSNGVIYVCVGEKLSKEGTIDRNPGGYIRYNETQVSKVLEGQDIIVEFQKDVLNTSRNAIKLPNNVGVLTPFRYCEVIGDSIFLKNLSLLKIEYSSCFNDNNSEFSCSDSTLNQIWDLCKHTIKATSFAGIYIDGDRERIPYEADAVINMLGHFCLDTNYELARNTCKHLNNNPTWPTEWILQTSSLFYYYYLYSGDKDFLEENYSLLKGKMLIELENSNSLINTNSNRIGRDLLKKIGYKKEKIRVDNFYGDFKNLIYDYVYPPLPKPRDIVDWPECERDGYEMKDINTVVNCFYYLNLVRMSQISYSLNRIADFNLFKAKANNVKRAINTYCYDRSCGLFVDGVGSKHSSFHANMFALAFDIIPESRKGKVIDFLKSKEMSCSVYAAQFYLEALFENNEVDFALGLLSSTGMRSWYNMIKVGASMTTEAWDMSIKPNGDWNHAWGAAPTNIITRFLWGIKPIKPGFNAFKIEPKLGNLEWTKLKTPTKYGSIICNYKLKDKSIEITIPEDITGYFVNSYRECILEGYNYTISKKDSIKLNPGKSVIRIIKY